ncbi:MAG: FAD-binding oxidoreductase [Gammaproteobacteria bacterium]|nr:FAD-binding oxidoreductase [Gammaproteobacteria bacterium]
MATPPGVSPADFDAAIAQLADVVGADWVFTDEETMDTYRDAYSPLRGEEEEKYASAAVAPTTVEEVRQIVRIANRYSIPLYTISTGRNLAYGGSAPVYSGSVVLDLKRMNRILEVDEDLAYALVEPGVSYFDLYRHIRERGVKLWIDCPDPGWGSLIGNALERGAGRTPLPYRDHFGAHCGMEVVLGNGDVLRTGMGALPEAGPNWQAFPYGAGPLADGLFAQSNYGIVTKMGFWLMPEPEASMTGAIRARRHDDIIPLVRMLAHLQYAGIVNCLFSLNSPVFQSPMDARKSALLDRADGGSAAEWDDYAGSLGTHFWETRLRFYGPLNVIEAQWEHVKARLGTIEGVELTDGDVMRFPLTDDQIRRLGDPATFGVPSLSVFTSQAGTTGHLDASPMLPHSGEALLEAHKVYLREYRDAGVPMTLGFAMSYHTRAFIMFQGINLTLDQEENARARALYERLIRVSGDRGWGIYRAHAAFMDQLMATYSYNDHALMRFNETLKDALDPNGILSAGRYGIWPRHLRGSRA